MGDNPNTLSWWRKMLLIKEAAAIAIVGGTLSTACWPIPSTVTTLPSTSLSTRTIAGSSLPLHEAWRSKLLIDLGSNSNTPSSLILATTQEAVYTVEYKALAIRYYTKAMEFMGSFATALHNRGVLYCKKKQWKEARRDLEQALAFPPGRGLDSSERKQAESYLAELSKEKIGSSKAAP